MGISSIMDLIIRKILLLRHSLENSVRTGPWSAFFPHKTIQPKFQRLQRNAASAHFWFPAIDFLNFLPHKKKATNIYDQHIWAKNALAWMCFINVGVTSSFILAARVLRSFSFSENHISSLPLGQWKCGELPKWASTILHLLKHPWPFFLPLFLRGSSLLARCLSLASQNSSPVLATSTLSAFPLDLQVRLKP